MKEPIIEKTELEQLFIEIPELNHIEIPKTGENRPVKSFVLRGQRLRPSQFEALRKYFYKDCLTWSNDYLDFNKIFFSPAPVVIEIGFGMGDSTIKIAKENPNINYIAFEVFLFGFSKTLKKIEEEKLTNIRLMRFNAVEAIENLILDNSISGFHIFFPDPWQKKRQNKRRIINDEFVKLLVKKLKPSGYIYTVTDWEDYAIQMKQVFSSNPNLNNPFKNEKEVKISWRPTTGFEKKGISKNHKIYEFWYDKKN
ncbi:MAG: tRNA (guanosine(46)-N7)-methyltransferase TrmB [Sphaerochaetaceae bacterium]